MIFRSPYPDVPIPEVSLTDFVLHRAIDLPDKPALIDSVSGRTLTFAEIAQKPVLSWSRLSLCANEIS